MVLSYVREDRMTYFPPKRDFSSLSVRDLLDAREAYHIHLAHFPNVVGTAVGRFLLRKKEAGDYRDKSKYGESEPRRLDNTVVRPWSWPSVIVFVNEWLTLEDLKKDPSKAIPKVLYLSDGRVVPTCIVDARPAPGASPGVTDPAFPSDLIGGGYAVLTDVQGQEHLGSIGCLVSDGDRTFALTNRHVAGDIGREIYSLIRGERRRIGTTAEMRERHKRFSDVYPGWPGGDRVFVTMDAGLIQLDDVNQWTAQVYGVGELDDVADLNVDTISLDLIGCPVRAFGAASGELEGKVKALFYRYRSVGGFDYVADLLIGPRQDGDILQTRPGDSGTLWVFDPPPPNNVPPKKRSSKDWEEDQFRAENGQMPRGNLARRYRPLALQWGGTALSGNIPEKAEKFALATFVSTISRVLDVDIIRDWDTGHPEYWGKHAHFKIGIAACDLLPSNNVGAFMRANRLNIGFADEDLKLGKGFTVAKTGFVPLADVPDYVWVGQRGSRPAEGVQHFADMDQEGSKAYPGKTLLQLCKDPANISADVWRDYYRGFPKEEAPDFGTLPFRVWQMWEEMVEWLREKDWLRFLGTAGTLAHYVGDACQPLHASHLHHGRGPKNRKEFKEYKKTSAADIHAIYEQNMFEVRAAEMVARINAKLKASTSATDAIHTGHDAAVATVRLIERVRKTLKPDRIVDADDPSLTKTDRAKLMFDKFSTPTAQCIALGCRLLARLWLTAWTEAGRPKLPTSKAFKKDDLNDLYRDRDFGQGLTIDEYADEGFVVSANGE